MKGYVGEACPECGNFTMVRNGTCLKCDTCGGTTGCRELRGGGDDTCSEVWPQFSKPAAKPNAKTHVTTER